MRIFCILVFFIQRNLFPSNVTKVIRWAIKLIKRTYILTHGGCRLKYEQTRSASFLVLQHSQISHFEEESVGLNGLRPTIEKITFVLKSEGFQD